MYILRTIINWLIGIVVLVLIADVSVSNSHEITFFLWPFGALAILPLWLIAIGCFSIGLILGGFMLLPRLIMNRLRVRQLTRQVARLENEQASKNLALKGDKND